MAVPNFGPNMVADVDDEMSDERHKVSKIHPLGIMNVCAKFQNNASNSDLSRFNTLTD